MLRAFQVIDHPALRTVIVAAAKPSTMVAAVREALTISTEPGCGVVLQLRGVDIDERGMRAALACPPGRTGLVLALVAHRKLQPALQGIAADLALIGQAVGVFTDQYLEAALAYVVREAHLQASDPRRAPSSRTAAACCPSSRRRSADVRRLQGRQSAGPG